MTTTRLYRHNTDGGAEYLSPAAVHGTDEGSFEGAPFLIRLDGDPEFMGPRVSLIAAAPKLLAHLRFLIEGIAMGNVIPADGAAVHAVRKLIAEVDGACTQSPQQTG